MLNFDKLADIIKNNQSFLITTHVNPDADAIGSEIAFYRLTNLLGKKSRIINHSSTPYNLTFLDADNVIEKYDEVTHKNVFDTADVLVALDFNKPDRIVSMQKGFSESTKSKICIDHHQDPEDFVNYFFIDTEYAATGHILFDFIKITEIVKMNREIADPLYAAIMTDTGSFRFERTSSHLHRIVAELLDYGVNPTEIYDKLYDESKLSKIKLLGRCLDSLQLITNNKIGYMIITQKDFSETGAMESDTENFVNIILSVEGVKLGLLFIELKNGFKVSFRSKGNLPVNKLAATFGGGGHINAAGARFRDAKMESRLDGILKESEIFFNNYSKG